MGYDFAPGALAGALALRRGGRRTPCAWTSATTRSGGGADVAVGRHARVARRRHARATTTRSATARVRTVRPAERVRSFTVGGRAREAISVGGAEHFALPAAFPSLREVNVYLGWFGPLARPLQAGSFVGRVRAADAAGAADDAVRGRAGRSALAGGPEAGTTPGGALLDRGRGLRRRRRRSSARSTSPAPTATTSPRPSWPGRRSSRCTGSRRARSRGRRSALERLLGGARRWRGSSACRERRVLSRAVHDA